MRRKCLKKSINKIKLNNLKTKKKWRKILKKETSSISQK